MTNSAIALLGQRHHPADGVADYCEALAGAMDNRGYPVELVEVPWAKLGWWQAFQWLWHASQSWQNQWVIVQYTASAWSKYALPIFFLITLLLLRLRRVRLAVMFHEVQGYPGEKLTHRIRRWVQLCLIQAAIRVSDKAILNVSLEQVPWLPTHLPHVTFIPVGSNIAGKPHPPQPGNPRTVAVFGLTSVDITPDEVDAIAYALREASQHIPKLRLVTVGRGSQEAEPYLRKALQDAPVELTALGLLSSEEIANTLFSADVLLYVRGEISTRRTTALAGLACGLPIVGYSGKETGSPIPEAGVKLVPEGDKVALAKALIQVLQDEQLWVSLHQRSLATYSCYFSYDAIAKRFLQVLTHE